MFLEKIRKEMNGMKILKNYVNGKWIDSKSQRLLNVEDPGTGLILARVPMSTKREVDYAVKSAQEAFGKWRIVPVTKRMEYLFQLKILIEKNRNKIANFITIEHGKVLLDSKAEVQRMIECINASLAVPSLIQGKILTCISADIDEYFIREPVGVIVHIAPFNFPAMIPFWYLPFIVACGNSFIVKPSEQTPLTMNYVFELAHEAGFPKGILTLINGDKKTIDALIEHSLVAGICSVTSTPVARSIYEKCGKFGKRSICQAGAKNCSVIMPSCNDLGKVVKSVIDSVYGNTNQRCLAASNVIVMEEIYAKFMELIFKDIAKIKIGYGLNKQSNMGPLISGKARENTLKYIETGVEEGANLVVDGRKIKMAQRYVHGHYLGPSVFTDVTPEMIIAKEEIFGPIMCVMKINCLNNAINVINKSEYGNGAIIYTDSLKEKREFELKVDAGNIGINIGLPAPIALFPFCGKKQSFFGTLHGQLPDIIDFCTDKKVVIQRCW